MTARVGNEDVTGGVVTVYRATTPEEAEIVRGRLENEGIPAMVAPNTMNRLYPSVMFMLEVQVPRRLAERAEKILSGEDPGAAGSERRQS
jgi:hypothetical protein